MSIEQRIQGAEAVGDHKTSMLQDLEHGRPLETSALVGSVLELAEALGIETPAIRGVYSSVCLLEARLRASREPAAPRGAPHEPQPVPTPLLAR